MKRLLLSLACVLVPLTCTAGGSVGIGQVDHLLRQKPQLRAALLRSVEMPDSAYAEVRLGPHFKHLSAYRLGPYSFQAQAKGRMAEGTLLVTVCTTYTFMDRSGKAIPPGSDQEFSATKVSEQLVSVVLRQPDDPTATTASCP